ncbi:MAG: helix-turn-helix transcriptional regulator [Oscillospiraceae bacterium]|nr:helix-turn-helix transcriptional regulator [Oscillospiraceae bacterium]
MAFYRRIRDLREDSDKTQSDIADYLQTSTQHYGKYENGNAEIPFERAIMLAKYYNVSLDYIAGLTNNKKSLSTESISQEQQELLEFIKTLTANDKKHLLELSTLINKL